MESESKKNNLILPAAIVIAGALVAGGLFLGLRGTGTGVALVPSEEVPNAANLEKMADVTSRDHVRGNASAPVKIVEYSDTECPFCKRFHETMKQVMEEYGASGKVAWVYRHFPLDALHSKADKEAEALECANEQGGDEAFWRYTDRLFTVTPSNDGLDPAELPKIAQYIGLDVQKFKSCLASGKYAPHVEDDTQNAVATGGNGTPWSIVVAKDGTKYPLSGAQPYESVKQIIDVALQGE